MFKAKQKTVSLVVACLTMLLTVLFAFAMLFAPTPIRTASAAAAYTETEFGEGKFLITTTFNGTKYYLPADIASSSKPPVATSFTDITSVGEEHLWTVTASGDNYYIQNADGKYLYTTSTNNGVRINTTANTWKYDSSANSLQDTATSRYLGIYNAQDWRCYTSVNQSNYQESSTSFVFYKINEGGSEEPKESFTLSFSVPNGIDAVEAVTVEDGTNITLPTTTAPDGYVFAGWSDTEITTPTTTKPTLYTDDYTVTAAATLYAVYHNDAEAGGWNLVTDIANLATGDTVTIVCPSKSVAIGAQSGSYFSSVDFDAANPSNNVLKLKVTDNGDNIYSFYTGTTYLAYTGSGNALHTNDSIDDNSKWKVEISDNTAKILNKQYNTRNLQYNASNPRFACYTSSQTAVALYEYTEGSEISYTSVFCEHSETYTETEEATCTQDGATIVKCSNCDMEISREIIEATGHQNTTTTTVAATCTENGSITVTCDDCDENISTEIIEAIGHSLDEGVITTQPDIGVTGVKTYTCKNGCGYTETESIPALDATKYTVSYSVPIGIEEVADSEPTAEGETIILPSANSTGIYTFLGWVESTVEAQTTRPEVYAANSEYTVTDNVTLYALYSYVNPNAQGGYIKVTENLADWSGEYLIVYETGKVAFNSSLATLDAVSNTVAVTITDGVIQSTDELNSITFTVALLEGENYSIQAKNGQYIGKTAYSNGLDTSDTTYTNTFSIDAEGNAVITASGNTTLRFNSATDQLRFRYYKTGQKAVQLYKYTDATYYATNLGEVVTDIKSATVTVGENLAVNYYVSNSNADAVMYFTFNGKTYDVAGELQTEGKYAGKYKYTLDNIPPQCMTDNISAGLLNGEVELDKLEEYSIQTYAQNQLNNLPNDELKQLLTDMLYYGAAAQTYKNYNTGKLATAVDNIGTASTAAPTTSDFSLTAATSEAYFKSATVFFNDVNQIFVRISTTENVTVKAYRNETEITVEVDGTTIKTDGILATGFADTYTFELSHNGTLVQTLTYSVNAYAYRMQSYTGEKADTMKALALALYRYGVSATAYAG